MQRKYSDTKYSLINRKQSSSTVQYNVIRAALHQSEASVLRRTGLDVVPARTAGRPSAGRLRGAIGRQCPGAHEVPLRVHQRPALTLASYTFVLYWFECVLIFCICGASVFTLIFHSLILNCDFNFVKMKYICLDDQYLLIFSSYWYFKLIFHKQKVSQSF